MNRNHLIGFAVAALLLALIGFTIYNIFEISPVSTPISPSREARTNAYLAFDRWLESAGIPIRVERKGSMSTISGAKESFVFLQSSLFNWGKNDALFLENWIYSGGILFLVIDSSDTEPHLLLEEFGITAETDLNYNHEDASNEIPDYDYSISFETTGYKELLALDDRGGFTRLVEVKHGGGKLIVTGEPYFLLSKNIGEKPNSRLAWALFMGRNETNVLEKGCLFIRGVVKESGLFGSLFKQGNFPVLLVSAFVLLAIGFWAVIPVFGLVHDEGEKPGKPLRERFLAEGLFLKKYRGLDFYRQAYIREIRKRLGKRQAFLADDNMENRIISIWGRPPEDRDSRILLRALRGQPFTYREFSRMIIIFKSILERI